MHCSLLYFSILCPLPKLSFSVRSFSWPCACECEMMMQRSSKHFSVCFVERCCLQSLNSEWMECCRGDRHTVRPVCTATAVVHCSLHCWDHCAPTCHCPVECADHGVYDHSALPLVPACLPRRWLNLPPLTWKSTNSQLVRRSLAQQ